VNNAPVDPSQSTQNSDPSYLTPPLFGVDTSVESIRNFTPDPRLYDDGSNAVNNNAAPDNSEFATVTQGLNDLFTVTPATTAANRQAKKVSGDITGQSGGCSWYNIICKASNSASEAAQKAGSFIQSTMYKILIMLVIVAALFIFMQAYLKKKAEALA